MNKLDAIYYEAIMAASEGAVNIESLLELHRAAAKFKVLDERQDAARFYERLYQIWRTLRDTAAGRAQAQKHTRFFTNVLEEYAGLLTSMGRGVRAQQVQSDIGFNVAGEQSNY